MEEFTENGRACVHPRAHINVDFLFINPSDIYCYSLKGC